ncbi:hypothetical protein SAMN04488515_3596 [Cognatiyoonia koreensis]|uniref:Uncharacterized protein n=1 Tax=Cognatiyoonia koreensis TaxID=364200 RepID=A0A1I0S060_9RHOB|nr:hypothetical protein SAMN04488515_3596 [Cognatiyoonia koreensis]
MTGPFPNKYFVTKKALPARADIRKIEAHATLNGSQGDIYVYVDRPAERIISAEPAFI